MGMMLIDEPKRPHLYENEWPWRVLPCEAAAAEDYYSKGFGSKVKALAYQKQIKKLFPNEPCAVVSTRRYFDSHGRSYVSRY